MRKLINVAMILCLFLSAPLIGEQVEEMYWIGYASQKVEPAKANDKRVATTFQLKYEDMQYTITNLHVCRIPHMEELRQRRRLQAELAKKGIAMAFPPLKDEDLVDKYIKIGDYFRKIIAIDDKHDLCILEGNPNLPSFDLADGYEKGELVRIIGFPRGLQKTLRKGRIFGDGEGYMPWLKQNVKYKLISTLAYGGNSGSPVINKYGNVVGVLFAGQMFIHTEAYIVPLEDLKNFLYRALK